MITPEMLPSKILGMAPEKCQGFFFQRSFKFFFYNSGDVLKGKLLNF